MLATVFGLQAMILNVIIIFWCVTCLLYMTDFFFQVDTMDTLFLEYRENPPLNKNNPPAAGAVYWSRSLFHRIKHTIIRFNSMDDMMTSEMGKSVSYHYGI